MELFHSLAGFVRVELTSADVAASIRNINSMNITMLDVHEIGDMTVQFTVMRSKLKKVQNEAKRKGDTIVVLSQSGLFWRITRLKERPIFVLSIVVLLALSLIVPSFVLFVEVEGNEQVPDQLIIDVAGDAGIGFGSHRRSVRSERIKNELLSMLPQLQWAGVNTSGCSAVISVKERAAEDNNRSQGPISSIVASRDGVITSCTATNGSCLCSVGQAVQKGQMLICSYMDCGGVITMKQAEGEIYAQTCREITVVSPTEVKTRAENHGAERKYSLRLGKKRINFYNGSGIYAGSCVKMIRQYQLALPGGYVLPVVLTVEQYSIFSLQTTSHNDELRSEQLSDYSKSLLYSDGIALSILDANEAITSSDGMLILDGIYRCNEMIGRRQAEQIGDFHGKTN